jgi:SagB-type dehydrogenase family enzyme
MKLPAPKLDGTFSVEKAIALRRSVRVYAAEPLTSDDVSQLLWAAQGVTDTEGRLTAPSAGGIHPMQAYLAAGNVSGVAAGIYRYNGKKHEIALLNAGDPREKLCEAALEQACVLNAPACIILTVTKDRTVRRYKGFAEGYINMEAGHAAENVHLQAVALGLVSVPVGAFDASILTRILWLLPSEEALYILPVGKPVQEKEIE